MKPFVLGGFLFAALAGHFASVVFGQTFIGKNGYKLQIEFIQDPPCPIKLTVHSARLPVDRYAHHIMLQLENTSSKPIRGYAMVSSGNRDTSIHIATFFATPFEPGKQLRRGLWPSSQERFTFSIDYVPFNDGTICGNDKHRRSIQFAGYLEARGVAITRLKQLAAAYPNSEEFVAAVENGSAGGFLTVDIPGPLYPLYINRMRQSAYKHVILHLRNFERRQKEALTLAQTLETEIPR